MVNGPIDSPVNTEFEVIDRPSVRVSNTNYYFILN
jgi:hypothetical protein